MLLLKTRKVSIGWYIKKYNKKQVTHLIQMCDLFLYPHLNLAAVFEMKY